MNLDPPTSHQLDRVVNLVRRERGEDLLGIALYGSAVGSGLRPRCLEFARADYFGDVRDRWDDVLPAARACAEFMARTIESMAAR